MNMEEEYGREADALWKKIIFAFFTLLAMIFCFILMPILTNTVRYRVFYGIGLGLSMSAIFFYVAWILHAYLCNKRGLVKTKTKSDTIFSVALGFTIAIEFVSSVPGVFDGFLMSFFVPLLGFKRLTVINAVTLAIVMVKYSSIISLQFATFPASAAPFIISGVLVGFAFALTVMTAYCYACYFVVRIFFKKWFKLIEGLK